MKYPEQGLSALVRKNPISAVKENPIFRLRTEDGEIISVVPHNDTAKRLVRLTGVDERIFAENTSHNTGRAWGEACKVFAQHGFLLSYGSPPSGMAVIHKSERKFWYARFVTLADALATPRTASPVAAWGTPCTKYAPRLDLT